MHAHSAAALPSRHRSGDTDWVSLLSGEAHRAHAKQPLDIRELREARARERSARTLMRQLAAASQHGQLPLESSCSPSVVQYNQRRHPKATCDLHACVCLTAQGSAGSQEAAQPLESRSCQTRILSKAAPQHWLVAQRSLVAAESGSSA